MQLFSGFLQGGQFPNIGLWGYFVLALLVAIEGPIATLLGAAAASVGALKVEWVFVAASAGNLTADSTWYLLGYLGKINWFYRFGNRLGLNPIYIEKLEDAMRKHASKILLIAKLTAGFIIPSLIAAGLAKIPWRRWFPFVFVGEMIWTGTLVLIGFFATQAIQRIEKGIEVFVIASTAAALVLLFFLIRRHFRKESQDTNGTDEE